MLIKTDSNGNQHQSQRSQIQRPIQSQDQTHPARAQAEDTPTIPVIHPAKPTENEPSTFRPKITTYELN